MEFTLPAFGCEDVDELCGRRRVSAVPAVGSVSVVPTAAVQELNSVVVTTLGREDAGQLPGGCPVAVVDARSHQLCGLREVTLTREDVAQPPRGVLIAGVRTGAKLVQTATFGQDVGQFPCGISIASVRAVAELIQTALRGEDLGQPFPCSKGTQGAVVRPGLQKRKGLVYLAPHGKDVSQQSASFVVALICAGAEFVDAALFGEQLDQPSGAAPHAGTGLLPLV